MIKIVSQQGQAGPLVFCDHCGRRIEDANDGNYYWEPSESEADVLFNHKACARAFERDRSAAGWFSGELIDFPIYLGDNLKLKWGEARKHARLMASI